MRFLVGSLALCIGIIVEAAPELRQILVLSRHGIRGPYGLGTVIPSQENIEKYVRNPNVKLPFKATEWGTSETDDPNEIVSPKITKHGYQVIEKMGKYFREYLYADDTSTHNCSTTFAYADANQRDNLTAFAFLSGMYPECPEIVPITGGTRLLFEQGEDPTAECPVCSKAVYEGITGANDTRYLIQEHHDLIVKMNDLLGCCDGSICMKMKEKFYDNPLSSCDLFTIPSEWNGAFYRPWDDTLSSSDYFSEWFLLQALNNMTLPTGFSFDKILSLAKIHEAHMDLICNEVNSANFGGTLLAHLTASMRQVVDGKPVDIDQTKEGPLLLQDERNKFLYYAGHDINLLYLRNILRLQWYTKGWHPHEPTPGGMLLFELWQNDQEEYFIKAFFMTASPEQMRDAQELSPMNPPDRVEVMIPYCSEEKKNTSEIRCSFQKFQKLVGKILKHECVAGTLQPFVNSLIALNNQKEDHQEKGGGNLYDSVTTTTTVTQKKTSFYPLKTIFGALVGAFVVIVFVLLVMTWLMNKHKKKDSAYYTQISISSL